MILTGVLKRVGGGISENSRSGPTFIDALEVTGHAEIRNVRGTRYIIDHVNSAVGKDVSIGLVGKAIVAIKHDDGFYKDESFSSIIISNAPLLIAGLIVLMTIAAFAGTVAVIGLVGLYFYFRQRVRGVISAVAAGA
ncbi:MULTISPECIES: hypothetical protein [Nitrosomonas]|uniref:hypothetical protein n=1 Tax=Nitrosomonas TaxID=914 RepID=UPI000796B633|nr:MULTISPECIES: hypothetical protein [Nitrosomonas]KXK37498.1 MAG: hypothetical protein UZ02_AOB001002299 [Nitrosomonas europaea]